MNQVHVQYLLAFSSLPSAHRGQLEKVELEIYETDGINDIKSLWNHHK